MDRSKRWLVCAFIATLALTSQGFAASEPRAELQRMTEQLRANPHDVTLRKAIIKVALTLHPAPALPEEAKRRMARGLAAMEAANDAEGVAKAEKEFEQVVHHAPWSPAGYYNLGVVQDKLGKYPQAIENLKLYLLAAPGAADGEAVQNLIYAIEFRQEEAAKPKPRDLSGNWESPRAPDWRYQVRESNGEIVVMRSFFEVPWEEEFRATLEGNNFRGQTDAGRPVWGTIISNDEIRYTIDFRVYGRGNVDYQLIKKR